MSLLQEQLNELGGAIIDVHENYIKLTGFMYPERLLYYLNTGHDCRYSVGVYPKEEYNICDVKDNSLCIIKEKGKEVIRYNFKPIKNDTIKYKLPGEKIQRSKLYIIRKCSLTDKYNFKDTEKSILFNNEIELRNYFNIQFGKDLEL